MGVAGLTPFLSKAFPLVIQTFPKRLESLRGSTIVVDGTLITQRLYFAPSPCVHRHVIGWYRLIREAQGAGVNTICVFDGKQRHGAKAQEIMRRKQEQVRVKLRATIEASRFARLSKMRTSLQSLHRHGTQSAARLSEALSKARLLLEISLPSSHDSNVSDVGPDGLLTLDVDSILGVNVHVPDMVQISDLSSSPDLNSHFPARSDDDDDANIDILRHDFPHEGDILTFHNNAVESQPNDSDWNIFQEGARDHPLSSSNPTATLQVVKNSPLGIGPRSRGADVVISSMSALYIDYLKSSAQLKYVNSITTVGQQPKSGALKIPSALAEASEEIAMSRTQLTLANEEGELWNSLVDQPSHDARGHASRLVEKSKAMSQSYQRRSTPPTFTTYEQCQELIKAMGIPCIETSGPYEAEALASSLVLNGLADYVASEDTDVLAYEAPLLRNVTGRQSALTYMNGSEIRTSLSLTKASYLDFLILLGTDFSQRIKNVGPARAYAFIRKYGTIENILASEAKYPPRDGVNKYMDQVNAARQVFTNLPPVPSEDVLVQKQEDSGKVKEILSRYGLWRTAITTGSGYGVALDGGGYFGDSPGMT